MKIFLKFGTEKKENFWNKKFGSVKSCFYNLLKHPKNILKDQNSRLTSWYQYILKIFNIFVISVIFGKFRTKMLETLTLGPH